MDEVFLWGAIKAIVGSDAAAVVILAALVLLIILLQKFGFCGLLWVVLFGFSRLLWVALLSFGRVIWPLLLVAVPALIMILPIAMVVEWVRERLEVARAPTTTGRGGGERNHSRISTEESANRGGPRKFTYRELEEATNSFASDLKLGEGASGTVYKGHIGEDREPVAVKIINSPANQRISEFIAEIIAMIQLSHTNLVKLKGYCHELNEVRNPPVCKFALVYEFIGGGTLYDHLFKPEYLLTWENRYNIALGLASALHYLRKKRPLCVIHRDIKSSNVMLDEALVAKLGDFGTAKLVDHTEEPNPSLLAGTPGYWPPEYAQMGVLSKESDIYSFGVVLLEIVFGRKAVFSQGQGQAPQNLVEWVRKRYRGGKLLDAVDSRLEGIFDEEQAEALTTAGLWCAHPDPSHRPSIEEIKTYLNSKAVPPRLPPEMPPLGY
ncbi:L-type lectin-domain containing receptor kinase IX.1-like [Eucalyptus grandis]|uniref:L-type lectin-domain containing receptor kinase IX.1-like n=1 Tax=Eucalyptus grandis TaxID=71139 RepID=UPI00192ECCA4|nr:L-type lectin-domain containing receptor kinase IX.1-like [Eucalyptus grandis]